MKTMYVGLENILVLVSAFRNECLPRPVFSFKTGKNQPRYVYIRGDIKELSNIEFSVISELPQRELNEVVEFLNQKYKLMIINGIPLNGKNTTINVNDIIYADYADVQGNKNYRARVENLKIKQDDFEQVKWFSDVKAGETSKDEGLTMKQLRKTITQKCLCGFEEAIGTVELKDLQQAVLQRRDEDNLTKIFIGLEGVLVLISEFEEEFPKPKFNIKDAQGKVKYIYLRKDISQLRDVKLGVISALNDNELQQIVKQLNEKYEMNIVTAVANNAEGFAAENIVYADSADNNANISERLNNLKALKRSRFIEMKWFSCESTGEKGMTLAEFKQAVRQ